MQRSRKIRIAIDCRIENFRQGIGVAVLALAKAFSDSPVADQEYTFIVREELQHWLTPYIYGPCRLVGIQSSRISNAKAAFRWLKPLRFLWHKIDRTLKRIPASDGYVESNGFDVVHFPTQAGYLTDLPSIYQPWDLQHLSYPQFFSKDAFVWRERCYRAYCDDACYVCVQTEWTRKDLLKHYGIAEDKVVVIPWGSVVDAYERPSPEVLCRTLGKCDLKGDFFFYPAVTWPHKNHEVILRALHILKSEAGIMPHVCFTGYGTDRRAELDELARSLGISVQVHFLGFLTPVDLQGIFHAATAMVFASKFEGFGLPILEAFHAQLPVICARATTLPEVADEGALYFDPDSPEELAALMKMVLASPDIREDLIEKGNRVLSRHSITGMAEKFQDLYRKTVESQAIENSSSVESART
jgi:glycosyltransferase involved in cell wall biosynthesis